MYQYYRQVQITEHCLRAEEIAGIFGIFTTSGKPHAMLMGALLKEKEAPIYFYESSKGLLKGYMFNDYYPVAIQFLQENGARKSVCIGGKNFNVMMQPKMWPRQQLIDKLNTIYAPEVIMV